MEQFKRENREKVNHTCDRLQKLQAKIPDQINRKRSVTVSAYKII